MAILKLIRMSMRTYDGMRSRFCTISEHEQSKNLKAFSLADPVILEG